MSLNRFKYWNGEGTKQERIEFIKNFIAPCCLASGNQGGCNHLGGIMDGKRIKQALIDRENETPSQ